MAETLFLIAPKRAAVLLASALMLGAPATGQGPFPPIPGPFPVIPGAGIGAQMPERPERPAFQPPANAMRMPYWMQTPTAPAPGMEDAASAAEVDASASAANPAPAPARTGVPQPPVATGYGQPMPFWAGPGYGAQGFAAQGYAPPGYGPQAPWPGYLAPQGAPANTQGTVPTAPGLAWPQQPGWAAGPAPGWTPAPYGPAPGWGGGWAAPVTGARQ